MLNNTHWAIKSIDSEQIFAVIKFKSPNDFDKKVKQALLDEYGWEDITFRKPDLESQLMELNYPMSFSFELFHEECDEQEYVIIEMYPVWEY